MLLTTSIKAETVPCPECGTLMSLARVTPRLGGLAELHSFECKGCRAVLTQVADERSGGGPRLFAQRGDIGG